jgi:iron complex transport system ATP-binding protein
MEIRLENVAVTVGGWTACRDVSLDLPSGSVTGLVGPNGAGKSSLLRCLYRALRPATGTVFVGGDDVWQLPDRAAGQRTAAVIQEQPAGFDLKVHEMVALGRLPHRAVWQWLGDDDHTEVDRALEQVGLSHLAERNVSSLSGGERQRALIARAVAQKAAVLVLDEPTNHLDVRHQLETLELVRALGVTVVAALHHLDLVADHCERVVVLDGGRLVGHGTPDGILTPELIRRVFGVEAEILVSSTGRRTYVLSLPDVRA